MKTIVALFCLHFVLDTGAQTVLTGRIYDVGTGKNISNAEVIWKSNSSLTHTNHFGDFFFRSGKSEESDYYFMHNAVNWNEVKNVNIKIHALNGSKLSETSVNADHYLIPPLKSGIYLLSLDDNNHRRYFKIMSNGIESVMVDTRGFFHTNIKALSDTLITKKEGYISREIPIQTNGQKLSIPMLSTSYENLDYFSELINPLAYDLISHKPSRSNLGDVREVKIIYDIQKDKLYYMNSFKYQLHYSFAEAVLGYDKGLYLFNLTQYQENPNRYLHMGSIHYYRSIDQYTLQFVTAVEMTCDQISRLYQKILDTSFLDQDHLKFYPNKDNWKTCIGISTISSEALYAGQTYQGLNLSANYGYLRKISAEELPLTYVGRRDIILTDGVPNDLPVVAGIITSDFQTPLSHINVLSHSRGTPNMALRGAWDSTSLEVLKGKLIYLNVKSEGFELRETDLEEANAFWSKREPKDTIRLAINVSYNQFVDLENADYSFVNKIGGKATNFAEILNVTSLKIPTPEGPSFAIPFHYYDKHMTQHGLYTYLKEMQQNHDFQTNASYRAAQLEKLRDSIINSPIDLTLLSAVSSKLKSFADFDAYRFRSSTNAEDLEDFSGAGLYESFSAKKGHDTKTIENAIKKVWASLWNFRAYEERDYFKIDHNTCAMGILVHRSFPDEDANGVLITKNLYNSNPGFIINAQYKEYSIVYPEPGIIHDQMLLFTWSVDPTQQFMLEYLSYSNIPALGGNSVMTNEEVFELGRYAQAIKKRFYYDLPHNCSCIYENFGVDIEFKVDSEVSPRKIYIKQARLYK